MQVRVEQVSNCTLFESPALLNFKLLFFLSIDLVQLILKVTEKVANSEIHYLAALAFQN